MRKRFLGAAPRYILPTLLILLAATAIVVPEALAANDNFGLDTARGSKIPKITDLSAVVGNILRPVLGFVGTIFLLLMVYAGFLWMTARGDAKKVDTAKQLILSAIIGIIIIASAYGITSLVLSAATGTYTESSGSESGSGGDGPPLPTGDPTQSGGPGAGCRDVNDCRAGLRCDGNVCAQSGAGGLCSAGDQCLSGSCSQGECISSGEACAIGSTCPNGAACLGTCD